MDFEERKRKPYRSQISKILLHIIRVDWTIGRSFLRLRKSICKIISMVFGIMVSFLFSFCILFE